MSPAETPDGRAWQRGASCSAHVCGGLPEAPPASRRGEELPPPERGPHARRCSRDKTAQVLHEHGAAWYAVAPAGSAAARQEAGHAVTSACGRLGRVALRRTLPGYVFAILLLALAQCASSGTIGRPPSMTTMGRMMMPILRTDPEYACVYEDYKLDFQNRIGAASSYRKHLAAQNSKLRTSVIEQRGGAKEAGDQVQAASTDEPEASVAKGAESRRGKEEDGRWGDVGRRYKELIPPNYAKPGKQNGKGVANAKQRVKSRVLSAEDLSKVLSTSNSLSWSPPGEREATGREKVDEAVLVLDLDKCSFWGSDGNDLGIALQWMEKGSELVQQLYHLLLNPQVKATYARLKERAKKVRVVIYTMRATFLVYHSCFRDQTVPLRWHPDWHHRAQIFIPPSVADADSVMQTYSLPEPLLEEEYRDLKKSFERLLATRAVLAEELQLERPPDLVVTASPKDVEGTMRQLGIPIENAYLWDDNLKLRDNPRVVQVPHFNALPPKQHAAVLDFLNTHCPAHLLEDDLVDFMMGADPIDVAIARDEMSGQLIYRIPVCDELEDWTLPCLVQTNMFQDRAVKGLAEREAEREGGVLLLGSLEGKEEATEREANNGHLSPVTPEHELDVAC